VTDPTPIADLDDKISIACANIKTALDALVTDGYFRAVLEDVINPFSAKQTPVLGMLVARWSRATHVWTAEILLMLVATASCSPPEKHARILTGLVDEKLDALAAAGTAGCALAKPVWETWRSRQMSESPLVQVGALGNLTITVNDPLLVRPSP
jgi:hypothetical protein